MLAVENLLIKSTTSAIKITDLGEKTSVIDVVYDVDRDAWNEFEKKTFHAHLNGIKYVKEYFNNCKLIWLTIFEIKNSEYGKGTMTSKIRMRFDGVNFDNLFTPNKIYLKFNVQRLSLDNYDTQYTYDDITTIPINPIHLFKHTSDDVCYAILDVMNAYFSTSVIGAVRNVKSSEVFIDDKNSEKAYLIGDVLKENKQFKGLDYEGDEFIYNNKLLFVNRKLGICLEITNHEKVGNEKSEEENIYDDIKCCKEKICNELEIKGEEMKEKLTDIVNKAVTKAKDLKEQNQDKIDFAIGKVKELKDKIPVSVDLDISYKEKNDEEEKLRKTELRKLKALYKEVRPFIDTRNIETLSVEERFKLDIFTNNLKVYFKDKPIDLSILK